MSGLRLGAPGIYRVPESPDRSLRPIRLDVAGFAGVAPRGPVGVPVPVRSWTDYQFGFGGFEGPGLLPGAVSVFFAQGGERAYVLRIGAHGQQAKAVHLLGDFGAFAAADEGSWGNRLSLRLEFGVTQQFPLTRRGSPRELLLPEGVEVPPGTLVRVRGTGLSSLGEFRWVAALELRDLGEGRRRRIATLDRSLPPGDGVAGVVTATLVVVDGDPEMARQERIERLGLHPDHPRYLYDAVRTDSRLVTPPQARVLLGPPGPLLDTVGSKMTTPGADRYEQITGADFFDDRPDEERALRGVDELARVAELGLLAVPDLLWSSVVRQPVTEVLDRPRSASFAPCSPPEPPVTYPVPVRQTVLDARDPGDLGEILDRQHRLVGVAERHRRFTVLLDVPQGLDLPGVAQWRSGFDSAFAAAYHPWLRASGTGWIPPSAFAAGIIAARERRFGLAWGPANELALGAVLAAERISDARHDTLHRLGVNVYLAERDGFRLTAARTLSRDPGYRQLSVRRLMTMLRLALERQAERFVFEPNGFRLRAQLKLALEEFLRGLYRSGAFAGNTEGQAFFVRCDDELNPRSSQELGRLVTEVGVAPAEPLEFLVLRIIRVSDGGVQVEEAAGG